MRVDLNLNWEHDPSIAPTDQQESLSSQYAVIATRFRLISTLAHSREHSDEVHQILPDAHRTLAHRNALLGKCRIAALLFANSAPEELASIWDGASRALESGEVDAALAAYAIIGKRPHDDMFLRAGNYCLSQGKLEQGLAAFRAVGAKPAQKALVLCGDRAYEQGDFDIAAAAYLLAMD